MLWEQEPLCHCKEWLKDESIIKSVEGRTFVPLVNSAKHLHAELDITMLRPGQPGAIIGCGGDIDNRLKTLFDALRYPKDKNELQQQPDASWPIEEPFYCLLEDDILITKVGVEVDRLLNSPAPNETEVLLLIKVTIRATVATWGNAGVRN